MESIRITGKYLVREKNSGREMQAEWKVFVQLWFVRGYGTQWFLDREFIVIKKLEKDENETKI